MGQPTGRMTTLVSSFEEEMALGIKIMRGRGRRKETLGAYGFVASVCCFITQESKTDVVSSPCPTCTWGRDRASSVLASQM